MSRLLSGMVLAVGLSALAAVISTWPVEAKELTIAVAANVPHLDPANSNDTLQHSVERTMYQGLFGFDKDMKLVPSLAEKVDVDETATEFVFHLRHGVTFHDGTPFDADAVKINLERLMNPDNHLSRRSLVSMVSHVDVVDPFTVKIVLSQPFGAFVNNMAHPGTYMISPKALAQYGKDIGTHPVGTGPFKFVSFAPDLVKTTKNEHYWKPGLPKVDGVTFKAVPESGSRFAMLQTGEAQFVAPLPDELVKAAQAISTLKVLIAPSIIVRYVGMNTTKKPFNDVRVREALNYAVDKTAFVKIVFNGYAAPLDAPIPPLLGYYSKQGVWPYDPAKAKSLLAEAGYPDGFSAELVGPTSTQAKRAMEFLQQQFAAVGVKVSVTPLEAGVYTAKLGGAPTPEQSTMQMAYSGWSSSTGDADWGLRPLFASKSFPPNLFNITYYHSPTADAAIEAGIATADPGKRATAYAEAQKTIWDDAPWVFLSIDQLIAGEAKNLSGVDYMPDGAILTEDASFN